MGGRCEEARLRNIMCTPVHCIRLRGPWEYEVLSAADVDSHAVLAARTAGRVVMPCDWTASLGANFRGRVRYRRRFHKPTGIDDRRIEIVLDIVDEYARVCLNERELGEFWREDGFRADVTNDLAEWNELTVDVELPCVSTTRPCLPRAADRQHKGGGLIGEVRLEISSPNATAESLQ